VASQEASPAHPRVAFVVPGGLGGVTGGNLYDRTIIEALERVGWSVIVAEPTEALPGVDVVVLDSLALRYGPPQPQAKVVALLHQVPSEAERRPEWREAEVAVLRRADLVVAVSAGVAAWVRDRIGEVPVVIPPGWDGAVARRSAHTDAVLCVANAHPGKGVPEAVDAYSAAGPVGAELVLVGDLDRDREEAARVRAALDRCPHPVTPTGVLTSEDLSRLYARAAVLLTASRYEGWPIAVAEAMASGVPVVGFDAPGVRELVRNGRDGELVPAGDVGALGRTLARVASDDERAERMGRAARRRARRWPTWDRTARRFAEELERLALRPPAPRTRRSPSPTRTP
jgi:glycosyltransferase involved in cell wall biosynthesis